MARIYSPDRRSRPPDPLRRSTRPARISPSGRVSFLGVHIPRHGLALRGRPPLRGSSSPIRNSRSLCSAEADYDVDGDSARNPTQRIAVSSQSLLARAPDTITHREQRSDTASPCRNGHRRMHLRRSRRNGAPWPSADARIFSSSIAAAGGGTTTAKSNSSCACARPFG